MSNRKLDSLTPEELLKALEESEHTGSSSIEVVPPVLEFIQRFNITEGDNVVQVKALQTMFNRYYEKLSLTKFTQEFGIYLPVSKNGFVKINQDAVFIIEQILKIAVKPKSRNILSSENKRKHFEAFLAKHNLKKGEHKVTSTVLYDLYTDGKKLLSPQSFYKFCDLYFNFKRGKECKYYLLNTKQKDLNGKESRRKKEDEKK